MVEAEFYGHEQGAYTDARQERKGHFERADGGTLFLDEIGDMDSAMQAKLLRTLESRCIRRVGGDREIPVDVRVVSATNTDLAELVSQRRFRSDLIYRLNTFSILIPPLRDRREDILPVAEFFLELYSRRLHKSVTAFDSRAVSKLSDHDYPGNIRELRNLIERAVILCNSDTISTSDLQFDGGSARPAAPSTQSFKQPSTISEALPAFDQLDLTRIERETIQEALDRAKGNRERAGQLLGISRYALRRRMRAHGLEDS